MGLTMDAARMGAASETTFQKGMAYARMGRVSSLRIGTDDDGQIILSGIVAGSELYNVFMETDAEGNVQDYECNCPAYDQYEGMCKHCVALYAAAYTRLTQASAWARAKDAQETDAAVAGMISQYAEREKARAESMARREDTKITITPMLRMNYDGRAILTFTLGAGRQYVLRDLKEFARSVRQESYVSYGKNLAFTHAQERFGGDSWALASFIVDGAAGYQLPDDGYHAGYYTARSEGDKKEMTLLPALADRFFAMWEGKTLAAKEYNRDVDEECVVRADDRALEISVKEEKGGVRLRVKRDSRIEGLRGAYVVRTDDKVIFCLSEAAARATKPVYEAVKRAGGSFFVATGDLARFCAKVLSSIADYCVLSGDTDVLEQFRPVPLEADVYLDAPDQDEVRCRAEAVYDEKKYDLMQDDGSPMRDVTRETVLRALLGELFPQANPDGTLSVRGDEAIFRLMDEDLARIAELATLHGTDRFRAMGIRRPPVVSVGVALEGGLLDIDFSAEGISGEELAGILRDYREKRKYHRLKDGAFVRMGAGLESIARMADAADLTEEQMRTGRASLPAFRAAAVDGMLQGDESVRFDRNAAYRALLRSIRNPADSDYEPPEKLRRTLRNYQVTGMRWMKELSRLGFGGILADDMGLGKTLQVIAVLLSEREAGQTKPSLVVCPASLALNWQAEIAKFAPEIPVRVVSGTAAQREEAIRGIARGEVVVTSYDLMRRDADKYKDTSFLYEIVDEAQYIKNHVTQNAKTVKAIEAEHRFALTGTPVENRLSELWSIFDFLMPGYLYAYQRFRKRYELPAVHDGDEDAKRKLRSMVAPFILRRLKKDVLAELPPKTETVMRAAMEGEQRKLYLANVAMARKQFDEEMRTDADNGSRLRILALLTRLRQICCDPALCYEDYKGGSAKLEMCMELVRQAAEGGHKTLLFSQFTQMLERIARRLDEDGVSYYTLRGDTPKDRRMRLVDAFNADDTKVFLISLKAGGTGLNLTGADTVIHYDPWWNVAAENQATDRAHRIGQEKNVQVYKLIAGDSIEEKILKLHDMKRDLIDAVLPGEGDRSLFNLRDEDIAALFGDA